MVYELDHCSVRVLAIQAARSIAMGLGFGNDRRVVLDHVGVPLIDLLHPVDDEAYMESIPKMFDYLRSKLGFGIKLTHDVHEHLRPQSAVALSKLLEPYRLFFLEDVLPPEQIQWFRVIRQQCTTPQAMGELFISPHEWVPLIEERLIDFVRVRISKGGGITQCRKIAGSICWPGCCDQLPAGIIHKPYWQKAGQLWLE